MAGVQTGVAFGSAFNSAMHGDQFGTQTALTASWLPMAGVVAKSEGMAVAKAIPFVGYIVNGVASAHDIKNTSTDYHNCMTSTKYD